MFHRLIQRQVFGGSAGRLVVLTVLFAAGCGSGDAVPFFPVRGTAIYKGQPIPKAELIFHPQFTEPGWMPVAVVAEDGAFEAGMKLPGDGAPAGRYKVTASWYRDATDEAPGRNYLPMRYSDVSTTPLEIEVRPESDEAFSLQLTD